MINGNFGPEFYSRASLVKNTEFRDTHLYTHLHSVALWPPSSAVCWYSVALWSRSGAVRQLLSEPRRFPVDNRVKCDDSHLLLRSPQRHLAADGVLTRRNHHTHPRAVLHELQDDTSAPANELLLPKNKKKSTGTANCRVTAFSQVLCCCGDLALQYTQNNAGRDGVLGGRHHHRHSGGKPLEADISRPFLFQRRISCLMAARWPAPWRSPLSRTVSPQTDALKLLPGL